MLIQVCRRLTKLRHNSLNTLNPKPPNLKPELNLKPETLPSSPSYRKLDRKSRRQHAFALLFSALRQGSTRARAAPTLKGPWFKI